MFLEKTTSANGQRLERGQLRSNPIERPGLHKLIAAAARVTTISVIIVSHNEKNFLARTVKSFLDQFSVRTEIIVVDDQSTDGSCDSLIRDDNRYKSVNVVRSPWRLGVSCARNFGASLARGEIIVFSDAHVEVPGGWARQVVEALEDPTVGAVVPAVTGLDDPDSAQGYGMHFLNESLDVGWLGKTGDEPYAVPLMCGCFLAMRRGVFNDVNGFDPGMTLYGSEDLEMSLHLWLRGYECRVLPTLTIAHRFAEEFRYPVEWEPLYNRLRMGIVHLGPERCFRLLSQNQGDHYITPVWERLANSDVWVRRNAIRLARRYDDDWYFERFGLTS
jgi:GT2 family glycosyltransferase